MRDRLIELIKKEVPRPKADALAYHLLANGVIVPPCKVGDKVFKIFYKGYIEELTVKEISMCFKENEKIKHYSCVYKINDKYSVIGFYEEEINQTIFLTKEEAEAKLKVQNLT